MTAITMAARSNRAAPRLAPYLAYARLGARQEVDARAALIARAAFLVVILFVFSRIWEVVFAGSGVGSRTQADLLWYIVITELVVLSFPMVHMEMEEDFRTGEVLVRLPLPVSYLGARLAEGAGGAVVRLAVFAPVGVMVALLFAGGLPSSPAGVVSALLFVVVATGFALVSDLAIAISAVWLHDSSPVYWIWQKVVFILGGLLLPLDIYPHWLRVFAAWTPFAAMLSGPGRQVFGLGGGEVLLSTARLAFWFAVAIVFVRWFWGRSLKALDGHGS